MSPGPERVGVALAPAGRCRQSPSLAWASDYRVGDRASAVHVPSSTPLLRRSGTYNTAHETSRNPPRDLTDSGRQARTIAATSCRQMRMGRCRADHRAPRTTLPYSPHLEHRAPRTGHRASRTGHRALCKAHRAMNLASARRERRHVLLSQCVVAYSRAPAPRPRANHLRVLATSGLPTAVLKTRACVACGASLPCRVEHVH